MIQGWHREEYHHNNHKFSYKRNILEKKNNNTNENPQVIFKLEILSRHQKYKNQQGMNSCIFSFFILDWSTFPHNMLIVGWWSSKPRT